MGEGKLQIYEKGAGNSKKFKNQVNIWTMGGVIYAFYSVTEKI